MKLSFASYESDYEQVLIGITFNRGRWHGTWGREWSLHIGLVLNGHAFDIVIGDKKLHAVS